MSVVEVVMVRVSQDRALFVRIRQNNLRASHELDVKSTRCQHIEEDLHQHQNLPRSLTESATKCVAFWGFQITMNSEKEFNLARIEIEYVRSVRKNKVDVATVKF